MIFWKMTIWHITKYLSTFKYKLLSFNLSEILNA